MQQFESNKIKILFLFFIVFLCFVIFLGTLFYWASIDRRLPRLEHTEINHALRGSIISADGFKIATSQKMYKAVVDTRNIDPLKKDLFIKLYALYSSQDAKSVEKAIENTNGNLVLSYKIDSKTAKYLQDLSKKLLRLGVFISYVDTQTGVPFIRGLNIIESGESRIYPAIDTATPLVGYVKKIEQENITKSSGVKGIERFYEDKLSSSQDSLTSGSRDISKAIILDGNSITSQRIDGYDVHLSISLKMQKIVENIIDQYSKKLDAREIFAGIMDSETGEMIVFASSHRFNPDFIRRRDYEWLNVSAVEQSYEPGSVMKTITFALLLKENKINPYDMIPVYGGRYKLGNKTITDTHHDDWLTAEDVIVYSSNVGTAQIAQKLDPVEFYQGLKDFGFSLPSGIDLPYENSGYIPPLHKFNSQIYKATVGYGYGMTSNFMQVLKAYNVFNNNGRIVTPMLVKKLVSQSGQEIYPPKEQEHQILPVAVAKRMQKIMIKVVEKGTGTNAKMDGLEIGGKTGTAHIAQDGEYVKVYNSSFFGFANDKKNRYTIGVLVREPKKKYSYFASQSAVPIFKEIVERLVENSYLVPLYSGVE
ncbi:MAG: penicillin-binding protein 2 [Sulfurospirillaceae bacterium]|nr:penicillin-binding protein 2 [Sulfurospirillaceae bacterium]